MTPPKTRRAPIRRTPTAPTRYPAQDLRVGHRVGWARLFLWQTGSATDERYRWAGTVEAVVGDMIGVSWDHDADGDGELWWAARDALALIGSAKWAD